MKIDDLIEHYGSIGRCADAFGVHRSTINNWQRNGLPQQIITAFEVGEAIGVDKFVKLMRANSEDKQP